MGHDHFGTVFSDAFGFKFFTYHKPGNVLQIDNGHLVLITQSHEVRAFQGAVIKQDAVVSEDAYFVTPDVSIPAYQSRAVSGLIFMKTTSVDNSCYHFAHVELNFDVIGDDAVEFVRVVERLFDWLGSNLGFFCRRPRINNLPSHRNGFHFIVGRII